MSVGGAGPPASPTASTKKLRSSDDDLMPQLPDSSDNAPVFSGARRGSIRRSSVVDDVNDDPRRLMMDHNDGAARTGSMGVGDASLAQRKAQWWSNVMITGVFILAW